jgi:hypothetical protein
MSAIVDDEDYHLVAAFKWYAEKDNRTFYARTGIYSSRGQPFAKVAMHRLIIGADPRQKVDHWDGDGLNNRRDNLRVASTSQNGANQRISMNNTTGFKGVSFSKREGRYQAALEYGGKLIWCGYHDTAAGAARAYDTAAIKYFGEFARLNFPNDAGDER